MYEAWKKSFMFSAPNLWFKVSQFWLMKEHISLGTYTEPPNWSLCEFWETRKNTPKCFLIRKFDCFYTKKCPLPWQEYWNIGVAIVENVDISTMQWPTHHATQNGGQSIEINKPARPSWTCTIAPGNSPFPNFPWIDSLLGHTTSAWEALVSPLTEITSPSPWMPPKITRNISSMWHTSKKWTLSTYNVTHLSKNCSR